MMRLSTTTFLAILLCLQNAIADRIDDKANQLLCSCNSCNIPGFAIAIKVPGNDPIIRAYGKIDASGSEDVTTDTAFMLASVSKPFVGAAIAKLIDQGMIQLDDAIEATVPASYGTSTKKNPAHSGTAVSWRMLATHRSSLREGIPDVPDKNGKLVSPNYGPTGGYLGLAVGNPTCSLTDVKTFYRDYMESGAPDSSIGKADLSIYPGGAFDWYANADGANTWSSSAPGSTSAYSNFGIGYLAALVEHKTGQSFEDYCVANLFNPLGMSRTKWFRESLPSGTTVAMPVSTEDEKTDIGHYCFIDYASGQLYSTVNDLAKWGAEMIQKGVTTLWSQATSQNVFGCQEKDANGNLFSEEDCEFSLVWEYLGNAKKSELIDDFPWMSAFADYDWEDGVQHSGGEEGISSHFIVLPKAEVYAVIVMNTDNEDAPAPDILGALFEESVAACSGCMERAYRFMTRGVKGLLQSAEYFWNDGSY